jgi:hypothetical protein
VPNISPISGRDEDTVSQNMIVSSMDFSWLSLEALAKVVCGEDLRVERTDF